MAKILAQVTGSDGHAPQYQPDSRWTTFNFKEIYLGQEGLNKYVPNVGDWVQNTATYQRYVVTAIDPLTLIPTMVIVDEQGLGDNSDLLVGTTADTYRVYLDTSVTPHILAVDTRFKVGGSMSQYAKMFRGSEIVDPTKQISFLYDTAGNYLTDQIPLELAALNSHDNTSIKVVGVAHTREKMKDGERVMVVVYNDQGHVVSKRAMLVENTSFIRNIAAGTKYVSHVSLESPFLSASNASVLEYPINVPLQAFNMFGIVHYSDGTKNTLPIDGTKFRIYGLERFVSTVVGQEIKLALSYVLDPTEVAYGAVAGDGKYVTAPYSLISTVQNGAYTVKLYAYPVWSDTEHRYSLRWFLMDLNRDILFDVTPYVYFNNNSDVFDPVGYNKIQNLSVRVNLKDVSAGLKSYIHTQTIAIVLKAPGTENTTRWQIGFEPTQMPFYGNDLFAKVSMINQNLWTVNVKNGLAHQTQWLNELYYQTKPLMDKKKEVTPPVPTHFVFVYGNSRTEYPIADWDKNLTVNGALDITGTLQIEFVKKTTTSTLRLAIAGLAIKEM